MDTAQNYALILSSGGIDSTACIHFYKKLDFRIDLLFFDYGQLANKKEFQAITVISKYYDVPLKRIIIKQSKGIKDGLVLGRNAMFYFCALTNFIETNGLIVSGIHYGTEYYDCSEDFLYQIQEVFDKYSSGTIKATAPFISLTKADITKYCELEDVPVCLTYSCELGKKQPCGNCSTCKELISIKNNRRE